MRDQNEDGIVCSDGGGVITVRVVLEIQARYGSNARLCEDRLPRKCQLRTRSVAKHDQMLVLPAFDTSDTTSNSRSPFASPPERLRQILIIDGTDKIRTKRLFDQPVGQRREHEDRTAVDESVIPRRKAR